MDEERDPLDIHSDDLALLQESQNIEFVVEEDDESSEGKEEDGQEGEPMYLYVDDSENDTNENEHNENIFNISDNEEQESTTDQQHFDLTADSEDDDDDNYEMFECLDEDEVFLKTPKKQNILEKNSLELNKKDDTPEKRSTSKVKEKNIKEAYKIKIGDSGTSQEQKIVTPKILKVQGGIVSPPIENISTLKVDTLQSGPRFVPIAPNILSGSPTAAPSLGVQKFLPDQAVLQIVKALGLSVEDIEKHGGTVAISIPDNLIQNGVLDLTKMAVGTNIGPLAKMSPQMLVGVPSLTPGINVPDSTKGKKIDPIDPKSKCYVEGCDTYEDKENVFFRPPGDEEMVKIWDICLGSVNRRLKPTDKLCTKHFHRSDILVAMPSKKRPHRQDNVTFRLAAGAVPCINLYTSCCVPGCKSKDPERMYNFPVYNKSNTELWIYMIRNPSLKTLNIRELLSHRVCWKHFDSDCFNSEKELRRTAAPTKHLPIADFKLLGKSKAPSLPDFSNVRLHCAYKKCRHRLNPTKKVFAFPLEFDRCQDWLYYCDRLDLLCPTAEATLTKLFYLKFGLCESHFEERDVEVFENPRRYILNANAIPRHFEDDMVIEDKNIPSAATIASQREDDDDEGDLLVKSREKSKRILPYVCFYLGCNKKITKRGSDQFFHFPKDPERRKLWLEACGYKNFGEVKVNYQICKLHFSSKMFDKNGKLKPNAVPIKSSQTIDGPSQSQNESDKKVSGAKLRISGNNNSNNNMDFDIPEVDESYYDTLDAIVAKWADKSKLEFLRCAIPKCDKVFTNQSFIGNAQMFPDPVAQEEWYKLWLTTIGSPVLMAMTPDILRQTYVVCNNHFDEKSLIEDGRKVVQNSIPTRDIPRVAQLECSKENFQPQQLQFVKPHPKIQQLSQHQIPKYPKHDGIQWKELDSVDLADSKDKTMCLLEDSNIVFPGMGYYLVDYPRDPKKRNKRPYGVYQYRQSKMYTLTDDIEFGEALNIHTAVVIDDDDAVERDVMQKILDKRLKV